MADIDNLTIKVTADTKDAVKTLKSFARSVQTQYTNVSNATGDNKNLAKQLSKMFEFDKKSISDNVKKAKSDMNKEFSSDKGISFSQITDDYLKNIKDLSPSTVVALKNLKEGFETVIPAMQNFNSEAVDVIKKLQSIVNLAKSYTTHINTATKAMNAFSSANKKMQDAKKSDTKDTGGTVEGVSEGDIANEAKKEADAVTEATEQIEGESEKARNSLLGMFKENIGSDEFKEKLAGIGKALSGTLMNSLKKCGKAVGTLAKNFAMVVTPINAIKPAIEGLRQKISSFGDSITRIYKMLRLMVLRKILQAGITGAIDGFKNLVQYSSRTNASVSRLYSSLTELKNALASMLTPLINASANFQGLANIANTVVQKLTGIVNAINQTLSALVGNSKWIKAKKLNLDYAKSLDTTANSAKNLNRQLQSIDELNVLNSDDDSSSDTSEVSASDMFEEADIEQKWKDLAEWLKSMWASGDFTELGSTIGNWLKNALESIPWDTIQETARKVGKSFATLLNGFVEVEGLAFDIGKTLAQGFNTIIIALNGFVKNIHGVSLGKFLAEFFNGALESIKWDEVYDTFVTGARELANFVNGFNTYFHWDNISDTIGKYVKTMADTIYTFFTNVDWSSLGANIGEQLDQTIKKIDWEGLGKAFGSILKSAIDFAVNFIKNIDVKALVSAIFNFLKGVFEEVDFGKVALIVMTLLNLSLTAKAGGLVSSALVDALSESLKDTIKQAFTKKAVSEVAGEAVETSITEGVAGNAGAMSTSLASALSNVLLGAVGIAVASVGGYTIGKNLGMAIAEGLGDYESVDAYQNFKWSDFFGALNSEDATGALEQFSLDVDAKIEEIKSKFMDGTLKEDITDGLNAVFVEPFDGLKLSLAEVLGEDSSLYKLSDWVISLQQEIVDFPLDTWNMINTNLDTTKTVFSNMSETISSHWSDIVSKLQSGDLSGALASVYDMFSETFGEIQDVMSTDVDAIKEKLDDLKTKFESTELGQAVDSLKTTITGKFDTLKTETEKIIDNLKTSLVEKFQAIKDAYNDIKNIRQSSGTSNSLFGFSFPTFATGGFPEDGWFRASQGEMIGQFDNGQSVVANNQQIVDGISQGVASAMSTQNAILYSQVEYLAEIASKEFGISRSDLFSSVQSSAQSYTNRTGRSAFA